LYIRGVADFLKELTAVATRGGGDSNVFEGGFCIKSEIGDEELFGVDRMMEREAREF
jgi:hypothetical protein